MHGRLQERHDGTSRSRSSQSRGQARTFSSVTKGGIRRCSTTGNEDCHVILRGGKLPNYDADNVAAAAKGLAESGIAARVMIDFSHGNSSKDAQKQVEVGRDVARQVAAGDERIFGIMMESHLKPGRQDLIPGKLCNMVRSPRCRDGREPDVLTSSPSLSLTRRPS